MLLLDQETGWVKINIRMALFDEDAYIFCVRKITWD